MTIFGQIYAGSNAVTFLVTRFASGFFAAAPLTIGGGVIADMFEPYARGYASTIFSVAVSLGPCLGPVIGSYLSYHGDGWHTVFWFLLTFGLLSWVLAFLFLPETYPPLLLARRAKAKRELSGNSEYYAPHDKNDFTFKVIVSKTLFRSL